MGKKGYYLGLDIGTNSVGWAVTDSRYKLQRFNKKDMWGSRLFYEALTAAGRRTHRGNRRRGDRAKKRIDILQECFAEEIEREDPTFFMRFKESKFHLEDKMVNEKFTLFADDHFTDKDYYKKYPTIYHLRSDLIKNPSKQDIRLIYIALHHIIKYRGNFLFEGQAFKMDGAFRSVFMRFSQYMEDEYGYTIPIDSEEAFKEILQAKDLKLRDKSSAIYELWGIKDQQFKSIISVMIGSKIKLSKIFSDSELDDAEKKDVEFKRSTFDEERDSYERILGERIELLNHLKSIYDWMVLSRILGDRRYISEAFLDHYKSHAKDLKTLKYLVRKYAGALEIGEEKKRTVFKHCFVATDVKDNYTSYVGTTQNSGSFQANKYCSQEAVNAFFFQIIKKFNVDSDDRPIFDEILCKLKEGSALPKLRTSANGVIPYQLHKMELDAIIENTSKHYNFFNRKDEDGFTIKEKIEKTMTFRIPYYVGPLNTYHSAHENGEGNSWMVRRTNAPIKPWNFDKVVDEEASAERFIRRMTNKCTYVMGADVIPKDSLLYEKYMVLNELNTIKLDGKALGIELKQNIFDEFFKGSNKTTVQAFRSYLKKKGYPNADTLEISGINKEFNSRCKSYHFFKAIIGEKIDYEPYIQMVERIIFWSCVFDAGGKMSRRKMEMEYGDKLNKKQINKIANSRFKGWGKFSEEFLCSVSGIDLETGERFDSIIEALYKTNDNLMQLLSGRYTFKDELERMNSTDTEVSRVDYDSVLGDSNLSPAVKRTVWQTLRICEEVKKIKKEAPERIFIEMTRNPDLKKEEKKSRRKDLISLYKKCKEDVSKFTNELEHFEDRHLRAKKLFLYYLQKGKCAYTKGKDGEIGLDSILSKDGTFDIDHIFPRSLTKDDSLDNLVLVTKNANKQKSDKFPVNANIQRKMIGFWRELKEQGFMSSQKYERLTRKDPLTLDELAGYINRQLVETGQSTKAVADILKKIYPEAEIVYVKSRNISELRQHLETYKCRELNNFHHAHDAFLCIVTGNVYYTKFTANPFNYVKDLRNYNKERQYNLSKMYDFRVERNGYVAWDKDLHLDFIKKTLDRDTVNVTRMSYEHKGELFNATLHRKTHDEKFLAPIKGSDPRLSDFSKYGGYNNLKGAYFFIVEHSLKNDRIKTIEQVLLLHESGIKAEADLLDYCRTVLNLIDPVIVCSKIKMGSKVDLNGFPLYIQSRTGDRIRMAVAREISLPKDMEEIYRKITKERSFSESSKEDKNSKEPYLKLYDYYIELLLNGEYKDRPNNPGTILLNGRNQFSLLEPADKNKTILQIHSLFGRGSLNGVDLSSVGGKKKSGVIDISKKLTNVSLSLIHDSVTGLYTHKKEIK